MKNILFFCLKYIFLQKMQLIPAHLCTIVLPFLLLCVQEQRFCRFSAKKRKIECFYYVQVLKYFARYILKYFARYTGQCSNSRRL